MDENPVVGRCGNQIKAPDILSFVDTYMGKELNSLGLTHSIVDVIALPFADSTEKHLHLIVDAVKNIPGFPALVLGVKDKALTEWELQPAYYNQLASRYLMEKRSCLELDISMWEVFSESNAAAESIIPGYVG
ncbi:hypothetical protein BVRB_2g038340 [Beta vulgaris subsp. vulgaris]|nr:hypothetical protein BVRB_2g038340 [Beta vulgaris subsp. vulgaris]